MVWEGLRTLKKAEPHRANGRTTRPGETRQPLCYHPGKCLSRPHPGRIQKVCIYVPCPRYTVMYLVLQIFNMLS
jgi:hypothetical protein